MEQELEQLERDADVGCEPEMPLSLLSGNVVDFSTIPTTLDARLEAEDPDGAVRPTIINVGKSWAKHSQRSLLTPASTASLGVAEQKRDERLLGFVGHANSQWRDAHRRSNAPYCRGQHALF